MDALKKWMIIRCTPYQTTTPPKWMFSQILFVQIILAAKWLVRHSSTFPKQQRRPLPSLLYYPSLTYSCVLHHPQCKVSRRAFKHRRMIVNILAEENIMTKVVIYVAQS